MTDKEIQDIIATNKALLMSHLEHGIVKDPALFWAGKMSSIITPMQSGSIYNFSNAFKILVAYKEEYDKVIFERTK
jgi:hypothetical protein